MVFVLLHEEGGHVGDHKHEMRNEAHVTKTKTFVNKPLPIELLQYIHDLFRYKFIWFWYWFKSALF